MMYNKNYRYNKNNRKNKVNCEYNFKQEEQLLEVIKRQEEIISFLNNYINIQKEEIGQLENLLSLILEDNDNTDNIEDIYQFNNVFRKNKNPFVSDPDIFSKKYKKRP